MSDTNKCSEFRFPGYPMRLGLWPDDNLSLLETIHNFDPIVALDAQSHIDLALPRSFLDNDELAPFKSSDSSWG